MTVIYNKEVQKYDESMQNKDSVRKDDVTILEKQCNRLYTYTSWKMWAWVGGEDEVHLNLLKPSGNFTYHQV
jgi:hypothetical protein